MCVIPWVIVTVPPGPNAGRREQNATPPPGATAWGRESLLRPCGTCTRVWAALSGSRLAGGRGSGCEHRARLTLSGPGVINLWTPGGDLRRQQKSKRN